MPEFERRTLQFSQDEVLAALRESHKELRIPEASADIAFDEIVMNGGCLEVTYHTPGAEKKRK